MSTLYEKSVLTFSRHVDNSLKYDSLDSIHVLSLLPVSINRDVRKALKSILFTESKVPMELENYEYRFLDIYSLVRDDFLMLINHSDYHRPEFLPEEMTSCHISLNYYEFSFGNLSDKNTFTLCQKCFEKTSIPSEPHEYLDFNYQAYWAERNWKFYNISRHFEVSANRFVSNIVKCSYYWCDYCIFTPLFQYLDYTLCKQLTSNHDFDNSSDSDASSVSDISHKVIELYDPFQF